MSDDGNEGDEEYDDYEEKRPPKIPKRTKKGKPTNAVIVEYHHEVIPFIYRMIGAKKIPINGNCLVHFDSHPDMLAPKSMPADYVYEKENLFSSLSIENWIIPAVYASHFNRIIWIKAPWATQIPDGKYDIRVGKNINTGEISLLSKLNYFLGEGLFSPDDELENTSDVELEVHTIGVSIMDKNKEEDLSFLNSLYLENYILDVDLDFFSTRNPFRELYKNANLYESLRELYYFEPPKNQDMQFICEAVKKRREQISDLKRLWNHISDFGVNSEPDPSSERWPKVQETAKNVLLIYNEVDWEIVHDAGCTWDDTDLPHHVSTQEQLEAFIDLFKTVVNTFERKPSMITISRSSEDDFCPPEDVEWIQQNTVTVLKHKFKNVEVREAYLELEE